MNPSPPHPSVKPTSTTTVSTNPEGQSVTTQIVYRRSILDSIPWATIATSLFSAAFILGALADQLPAKLAIPAASVVTVAMILGRVAYKFASRPVAEVVTPPDAGA